MSDWEVICGDCVEVMREMDENSVDTIITDPPYGLEFMGKQWDKLARNLMRPESDADKQRLEEYGNTYRGRRSKLPDLSKFGEYGLEIQNWHYRWAVEALRVAKPGAILMVCGGTRTWHRLACAIEDAGWEIRDTIAWMYGSGFPKSYNISKGIDKMMGRTREVVGYKKGVGGENLNDIVRGSDTIRSTDEEGGRGVGAYGVGAKQVQVEVPVTVPATSLAAKWDGWGTALKPAWEAVIVAMAPRDGTFAHNAEKWGVAGLWIDGGRVPTKDPLQKLVGSFSFSGSGGANETGKRIVRRDPGKGRWPANVILDSKAGAMLDEQTQNVKATKPHPVKSNIATHGGWGSIAHKRGEIINYDEGDATGASRFFQRCDWADEDFAAQRMIYCAKASRGERDAGLEEMKKHESPGVLKMRQDGTLDGKITTPRSNYHPTVKPLSLMRYLCRLTKTPDGGVVLDPFAGSGSTGCAAVLEGRDFIGIEMDPGYCEIARRRIAHWAQQPPLEGM